MATKANPRHVLSRKKVVEFPSAFPKTTSKPRYIEKKSRTVTMLCLKSMDALIISVFDYFSLSNMTFDLERLR